MKFKVGDKVRLVRHMFDTKDNLEIGYTGTVKNLHEEHFDGDLNVYVVWNKHKEGPYWWVHETAIAKADVNLENK